MFKQITPSGKDSCVIDALSIAMNKSPNDIIDDLKKYGEDIKSEKIWGKYLVDNGFHKVNIPQIPNKHRADLGRMAAVALKNQIIICKCAEHVVAIKDNTFFDSTDNVAMCVFWYYTN